MKKNIFLIFIFLASFCFAQPIIDWQVNLGGSNGDLPFGINQTTDKGFILTGTSASIDYDVTGNHGITDSWLVKLDSAGTIEWQKCFGGSYIETGWDVSQTSDHGYIMISSTLSTDGDISFHYGEEYNSDYWVVKTDSIGNLIWEKTYGGSLNDAPTSIRQTMDGGYIIGGTSNSNDFDISDHLGFTDSSDFWIVKVDSMGNLLWEKSLGGNGNDDCAEIIEVADGSLYAMGSTGSTDVGAFINHGESDFLLIHLSASGDILWQKTYGGSDSETASSVRTTTNNGFIMTGITKSNDGDVTDNHGLIDFWAVRINAIGDIIWQKCFGGSKADEFFSMSTIGDQGFIFCGTSASSDGDVSIHYGSEYYPDIWIVKTDTIGAIDWQKTFGGSDIENAPSIISIADSVFVFTASTASSDFDIAFNYGITDFWVVKLDSCTTYYFYADQDEDSFGDASTQIISCTVPNDYVSDSTDCDDTNPDIYPGAPELLNGYDDNCNKLIDEGLAIEDFANLQFMIYPVPATNQLTIVFNKTSSGEIEIYNLLGEIILQQNIVQSNQTTLNIFNLIPGNYLIRFIDTDLNSASQLFTKIKSE